MTFYTTHCPKCAMLEKLLKDKSLSYETIDLLKDSAKMNELVEAGYRSAPLLGLDDGRIVEFKEAFSILKTMSKKE